jgi:hypothetical protein
LAGMRLRSLDIPPTARTDLGLKHYLAAVEPPRALYLDLWDVTDAGLKELAGLKGLRGLSSACVGARRPGVGRRPGEACATRPTSAAPRPVARSARSAHRRGPRWDRTSCCHRERRDSSCCVAVVRLCKGMRARRGSVFLVRTRATVPQPFLFSVPSGAGSRPKVCTRSRAAWRLKVLPRPSPRWSGQGPRRWGPLLQQLAHGMADGDGFLVRMLGDDAGVQSSYSRIEAYGAHAGHPQVAADQVVALATHDVAFGATLQKELPACKIEGPRRRE